MTTTDVGCEMTGEDTKKKLLGLSLQANYTDRATAACQDTKHFKNDTISGSTGKPDVGTNLETIGYTCRIQQIRYIRL
jgi:hypothetical protein